MEPDDPELSRQADERFRGGQTRSGVRGVPRQAEKRLDILDAATSLTDLQALTSNALEGLKGDRKGQHSIRINMQWRICFEWPDAQTGPSNVEIVDYH
jgi:proteic killer suppression protein